MTGSPLLIATTAASAFIAGVALTLVGSLRPALPRRLNVDETRLGGGTAARFLTLIRVMLVAGLLIDKWGTGGVLLAGCLLAALGSGFLTLSGSRLQALGSVLLVGAGAACLAVTACVLMPRAFFADNAP